MTVPSASSLWEENKEEINKLAATKVTFVIDKLRQNIKTGKFWVDISEDALLYGELYGPIFTSAGYVITQRTAAEVASVPLVVRVSLALIY